MQIHEWMIKHTRQTEWIDGRGILLWLAIYAGGLGGGLYLISLWFNNLTGIIISWFIVAVVKGGLHFAFLGKPWRIWRIMTRFKSSWLSRGFVFVVLFVLFGAVQIILSLLLPGSVCETILKAVAAIMAFGVALYMGFVLNNVKSIPFWSSNLLPLIFLIYSFLGGLGVIMILAYYTGTINMRAVEDASLWLMIMNSIIITTYIFIVQKKGVTANRSLFELMHGSMSSLFWVGVVTLGIAVPLLITFTNLCIHETFTLLLLIGAICEIVGSLALRFCILRTGIYQPLLPIPATVIRHCDEEVK